MLFDELLQMRYDEYQSVGFLVNIVTYLFCDFSGAKNRLYKVYGVLCILRYSWQHILMFFFFFYLFFFRPFISYYVGYECAGKNGNCR